MQINPDALLVDMDSTNAHTFCSRDIMEEELEINIVCHYMLKSYRELYGKTITVQWHYGNESNSPPTSCHYSCEGPRQGNAIATVYFNVLAARICKKQLTTLNGRGVLYAIAGDVKIIASPPPPP